ncbi:helix-turn-helix domain-containing protein [Pseudonocardia broussonetiae]|uniref:Helix-turn-helix domain-containing protein n=1 Tax=Pseudonocardia broussonetiae TaxID=2736640 RepID=A0A6M6JYP3_9PSEU|nr:helix-turn-helix transcriptional regulator [Pseudonocardia broussonetiae]QJY51231.1 helix-turn-helix domain-containing protein [Pseudonocardia broussonetiae]
MVQTRTVTSVQINGPALRVIRELSGLSCSALARAVGADVSFLARVERGEKRGVNRRTYERLVRVLRIADARAILADPYRSVTRVTVAMHEPPAHCGLQCEGKTSTAA